MGHTFKHTDGHGEARAAFSKLSPESDSTNKTHQLQVLKRVLSHFFPHVSGLREGLDEISGAESPPPPPPPVRKRRARQANSPRRASPLGVRILQLASFSIVYANGGTDISWASTASKGGNEASSGAGGKEAGHVAGPLPGRGALAGRLRQETRDERVPVAAAGAAPSAAGWPSSAPRGRGVSQGQEGMSHQNCEF